MSLFIASLNSGSNGNCYYIGNRQEAVLVDAGLSCRETEIRMKRLGLSLNKVKALFISHEHSDHIKGVNRLSKKFNLPVYISPQTREQGRLVIHESLNRSFENYEPISVGGLSVTAFPTNHDACDPHSFVVTFNNVKVGVITDVGFACEHVVKNFQQCHAVFLEANYDEELLENGRYPLQLKNRIRDGKGHLSNKQALELFISHKPSFMSHLILAHLSEENNRQKIVKDMFSSVPGDTKIIIASRSKETKVHLVHQSLTREVDISEGQLSLF